MNKKYIAKTALAPVFVLIAGISFSYAATVDWSGPQAGQQETALEQISDVSGGAFVEANNLLPGHVPPPIVVPPDLPPGVLPGYVSPLDLPLFQSVYDFFYSSDFLNNSSLVARLAAKTWLDRGFCGDMDLVNLMKVQYKKHYTFAYGSDGLTYTSTARKYAISAIRNIVPCGDLLRGDQLR